MTVETRVFNVLKNSGVYPQDIWEDNDGHINFIISGDWKHDHLLSRHLMFQLGYDIIETNITPSDTDFYTAHYIYRDQLLEEGLR